MAGMGRSMMGTGEADGDERAVRAAEIAIANPLLEDYSLHASTGVLINITGGSDMTLFEVDAAARVQEAVAPEANIIFGSAFDESLEGIRLVVATGIEVAVRRGPPEKERAGGRGRLDRARGCVWREWACRGGAP